MKMPTIVGIFIFISGENFMFNWVKHEQSFITFGQGLPMFRLNKGLNMSRIIVDL